SGRKNAASNSTLEVWNDNIVRYGTDIIEKRYRLLAEFRDEFKSYVNSFFKGVEVDLFYIFSWDRGDNLDEYTDYFDVKSYKKENFIENNLKDIFYRKLTESLQKDLLYK
ncbi:MAG: hypothetical protein GW890_13195, partial [Vibrio sp.]|nr:hypothetical protein [Vibrio sp.]